MSIARCAAFSAAAQFVCQSAPEYCGSTASQCRDDAHLLALFANRALENVSDAELGTDLFQTDVLPFVEKRGRPPHDSQASDVRKRVENFLRHSDGKRLLIMVRR